MIKTIHLFELLVISQNLFSMGILIIINNVNVNTQKENKIEKQLNNLKKSRHYKLSIK